MKHSLTSLIAAGLSLTACSANPDDGKDRIYADDVLAEDNEDGGDPNAAATPGS